jgi:hypothetical protein
MFGPKLRTVFSSRWKALWFSASVLLTAYCSVPDGHQTQGGGAAADQHQPANPWALKPGEKPSHLIR